MAQREYFSRLDFKNTSDSRKREPKFHTVGEKQKSNPLTKRRDRQDFPSRNKWAGVYSGRHEWTLTYENREKNRSEQLRISMNEALSPEVDKKIWQQMQDENTMMADIYDEENVVEAWKSGEIDIHEYDHSSHTHVPRHIEDMEKAFGVGDFSDPQVAPDSSHSLFNGDSRGRYRGPTQKGAGKPARF